MSSRRWLKGIVRRRLMSIGVVAERSVGVALVEFE